jgi:FixJ family two-component response regulator
MRDAMTPRQVQALDALIAEGCNKLAADRMGISVKTLDHHIAGALAATKSRLRIHMLLAWDRENRAQG